MNIEEILAAVGSDNASEFAERSELWRRLLGERPEAAQADWRRMLSPDSGLAAGVGLAARVTPEAYKTQVEAWVERYRDIVTPQDLETYPEPALGEPRIVETNGYRTSLLYLKNFALAKAVQRMLRDHVAGARFRNVLEIGAGYGGMLSVLMRMGEADRVSVIDLAEALPLSAWYLTNLFADRTASIRTYDGSDLRFFAPSDVVKLNEAFDLVLNVASLGEMPQGAARKYVEWISTHLSDDGVFVSHNGHMRTADGVKRQSDYGYDAMGLVGLYPQPNPAGIHHDQHVVALLGPHGATFEGTALDDFAVLVNLGLHEDAAPEMAAFARAGDRRPLDKILERGAEGLGDDGDDHPLAVFLAAARLFVLSGETDLFERYLEIGQSSIAIAFAQRLAGKDAGATLNLFRREAGDASGSQIRARFRKAFLSSHRFEKLAID